MRAVFRSLATRNYRLYFTGQVVSLVGTWMQITANAWLVLKLTNSGFAVGLASAIQFAPMLIAGVWGGWIADRFPKRRTLLLTQFLFLVQAALLGALVGTGVVRVWMVYALIVFYGIVQVADVPARQAFVSEMVKREDVMNAVGLNSAVFNGARLVGPAAAGFLIKYVSFATCFYANAASYLAVLVALALMHEHELYKHDASVPEGPGQIRAGLGYVRRTPVLWYALLLMAVVGTLGLNFQIVLPLLAKFTFRGDASTFGLITSIMAVGSLVGAMYAATRHVPSTKLLVVASIAFGITMTGAALVPSVSVAFVVLPLVGLTAMVFISTANTVMQLTAEPQMRGRVLALWSLVFLGSTPVGGPLVGWISEVLSPRWGLAVGGIATLVAGLVLGPVLIRNSRPARPEEALEEPTAPVEAVAAAEKT